MNTPVLQCHELKKHYRQGPVSVDVLKGISFSLNPGERLGIIGASGSGKSTLLNMLGGLDQPSHGSVELMNSAFSTLNDNKRAAIRNQQLGFVYQFHHLLGEFSAIENVALPNMIAGNSLKKAKDTARVLLDRVGLSHRLEHKPSELSGGERQRVAIARSLINKPACVLMDEPTGNLDRQTAESVQNLLKELSEGLATSFIIVTHDEQVAHSMDRIAKLDDGLLTLLEHKQHV